MADGGNRRRVGGRQALVLCGGLGTRLREAVPDRPKAMAPIRGKPFLEILLRSLKRRGVGDVVLATGHLGNQIEDYFEDGRCWDLAIRYSREPEPLGTGGAVKLAEPLLRDRFLILNGDTFVDFDPAALEARMDAADASLVLALRRVDDASRYGAVDVDAGRRPGRLPGAGMDAAPPGAKPSAIGRPKPSRGGIRRGDRRDFHRHRHPRGFRPRPGSAGAGNPR
jgi:UTP-glucose-1-phosphate uridylyltransferase